MNQTVMTQTDLERLAERVEKAAEMVERLRAEKVRLERERDELQRRLEETKKRLHGQDPADLMGEVQALRREQREWVGERRDVATRIETLVRKLEKLEA
jgi:chromosome segregation ATPase